MAGPFKMKGSPMQRNFGPKKSESTAAVDSLQKVTNDILISNTPNPNREAEYKASEKKMNEAGNTVDASRKYNVSRGKYIKKTQKINQSGKGQGGTIKQTPSNKTAKKATYKNTGRKA